MSLSKRAILIIHLRMVSIMAHYKRQRSRRHVRCTLCTPYRWRGNGQGRFRKQLRRSNSRRLMA